MKIKVLIADDNSFIREGMKIILSTFPECDVVASVDDGEQAVAYCREHEVDVVLLDVRMPNMNGVEATRILVEENIAKPLIMTTFDDDEYILDAVRFGAMGYLLKNNDPERIRDAIKSVYNGQRVLQDVVMDKIRCNLMPSGDAAPSDVRATQLESQPVYPVPGAHIDRSLFTERELEVMEWIAKGLSNKEISRKLFISEGTIANYITSVFNKTGLEHRTQIAIYYLTGSKHQGEE